MAQINLGILDGFSGKVGNVVGYKRYGKGVMRAYVKKVRNPRTDKQQLSRARFKALLMTSKAMLPAVKIGLSQKATEMKNTPMNCFMSLNKDNVSGTDTAAMQVDYRNLVVSYGNLPEVSFGAAKFDDALTVEASFASNSDVDRADAKDRVYLFVYSEGLEQGVLSTPVSRSESSIKVKVPTSWSGQTVHVYGFAVGGGDANCDMRSKSSYIGSGDIV